MAYQEQPSSDGDQSTTAQKSSGVTSEQMRAILMSTLNASVVEITDMSGGCGQMFEAIIVSDDFSKKSSLARHRLVNGALKPEIAAIHAWTPKCFTTEEWARKQSQA